MRKLRLLIAEDETLVRHALAQILGAEEDIEVVGEAANGEAAIVAAQSRQRRREKDTDAHGPAGSGRSGSCGSRADTGPDRS